MYAKIHRGKNTNYRPFPTLLCPYGGRYGEFRVYFDKVSVNQNMSFRFYFLELS